MPQDGGYDISVAADPGAAVTLEIGGAPVPVQQAAGSLWQNQGPVSLVAGQLAPVTLTVTSLRTTLSVSWQSPGLGWQLIPGQYLYSGHPGHPPGRHLRPVPQGRQPGGRRCP